MTHLVKFQNSLASRTDMFFEVPEDGDRERQDNTIFGEEGMAISALYDIPSICKHRIQLSSLTNKKSHSFLHSSQTLHVKYQA